MANAQLNPNAATGYEPTIIKYSLIVGGIERGDGYSVPTIAIKLAGNPEEGWEFSYAQGGFKMGDTFSEKETLVTLGHRLQVTEGLSKFIIGINGGVTQSENTTQTKNQIALSGFAVGTSFSLEMSVADVGVRIGVDSMVVPLQISVLGVRNFWYAGLTF